MFETLYNAEKGLDRGLQFGDGHFTTLVFKQGEPQLWAYHKQRLIEANQRLGIPFSDHALSAIEQAVSSASKEHINGVAKIIITRGNSRQGYRLPEPCDPNWYLTTSALPPSNDKPIRVTVAETRLGEQPLLAGLKTLNRLEQVMLHQERLAVGTDDLIVCSSNGYIIEAIQGNLFWCVDGHWYTPQLTRCGVAGVARQRIIDSQLLPALKIVEASFEDISSVSDMFIANSVKGLIPVMQIRDKVINTQIPAELKTYIDETCA